MKKDYSTLQTAAFELLEQEDAPLQKLCELLKTHIEHFNWVGFYFMNAKKEELEIGPYAGETTSHTTIPFGKGICGQVALSGETFLSQDVSKESNYLACSVSTKAELVVPIYKADKLVGQIDIDSNLQNAFTSQDEALLKAIGEQVVKMNLIPTI